jgi:hypothetical protein
MSSTCYATIVSANYLAYAKVLAESVARHCDGAVLRVLLVERSSAALRARLAALGLEGLFADELGLPDFERIAYKYDILELNTALKPSFLKQLFAQGAERLVYLDPDICLYGALQPVHDALDQAAIVLTPHALQPLMDGRRPSDIDFLRNGVFNLGFIALRRGPQSLAMLDWWEQRCLSYGYNDVSFGTFVDQKWANLIPAYFDATRVLRHPGCNVAYWNLHERDLQRGEAGLLANGQALQFFHFSGVSPTEPGRLSKHQDRHNLEPDSVLADLVEDYCRALLAAGHAELRQLQYSFALLDDGHTRVGSLMRRALDAAGEGVDNPFEAAGAFQLALRSAGLQRQGQGGAAPAVNTHNLQQLGWRLRWADRSIRLLFRLIGLERGMQLLRYAAFITRESHLPSVLLRRPLRVRHEEERRR